MLSYIRREQSVLGQILATYPDQIATATKAIPNDHQHWVILTTASSLNAATTASLYMQKTANVQVDVYNAAQFLHYGTPSPLVDVIIGISISGQDAVIQAAVKKAHAASDAYTIALTADASSPLAVASDATCDLLTGQETVPYITLSYQAIVLTLMLLSVHAAMDRQLISSLTANQELDEFSLLIENMNRTIQKANDFYRKFTIDFANAPEFTAIGSTILTGTLAEFETKFTEIVRVPTHGYPLVNFTHGGYLGAHENHCQFYVELPASDVNAQQLQAVKAYESRLTPHVYTISLTGEAPAINDGQTLQLLAVDDPYKAPLLAVIPFQVLAWYIAKAKGINLSHPIFTDFQDFIRPKQP